MGSNRRGIYTSIVATFHSQKEENKMCIKKILFSLIAEKPNHLKNSGCHLLFTDGSKSDNLSPAYTVVDLTWHVQSNHIPHESASFTVKARAIFRATNFSGKEKFKTVMTTVRLSVIKLSVAP